MKALMTIASLLLATQAFAFGFGSNKMADAATVSKALANPYQYRIDDGGNINFGNGFYIRRINFAGKAQVCHSNNYLYGGVRNKCVKPVSQGDEVTGCKQYKQVQLKTQMVGTAQVCTDNQGDGGPCTKYATVKFNKGPQVKVAIYKKSQMSDSNPTAGFKGFTYLTIPACND